MTRIYKTLTTLILNFLNSKLDKGTSLEIKFN